MRRLAGREARTHEHLRQGRVQGRPVDAVPRIQRQHEVLGGLGVEFGSLPGQRKGANQRGGAKRVVGQRDVVDTQKSPERLCQRDQLRVVSDVEALGDAVHQQMPLDLVHVQQCQADGAAGLVGLPRGAQVGQRSRQHRFDLFLDSLLERRLERAVEQVGLFVQHAPGGAQVLRLRHMRPRVHQFVQVGAQDLQVFLLALGEKCQRAGDQRADMAQHQRACGGIHGGGHAGGHQRGLLLFKAAGRTWVVLKAL